MECRAGCAACCIIPGISASIPGMEKGKPPFTRCIQLDDEGLCKIFGHPSRPLVCERIKPEPLWCGSTNDEAFALITELEYLTQPT